MEEACYIFVLIRKNYIPNLFKVILCLILITGTAYWAKAQTITSHHKPYKSAVIKNNTNINYRNNSNAQISSTPPSYCPLTSTPIIFDAYYAGSGSSIGGTSTSATLSCGSLPFYIDVDNSSQIVTPCVESEFYSNDITLPNNGTEYGYEGSINTFCLGPSSSGCIFPIGGGGGFSVLGSTWGLLDIFSDPSQQHTYQFCYNSILPALATTTIQLQDCWSGDSLSLTQTFNLLSPNHCFTDSVLAGTDIGTASYSIAPATYSAAIMDYHNGETYVDPSLLPAGTYTVTYSFKPPVVDSCPTITGVFKFTITPTYTVVVNSPTVCAGNSATLTASGGPAGTNYNWQPSSGLSTSSGSVVTATPGITSIYTVTGTHSGCSAIATSTVTVNPIPTVTVNSATICSGATATLTANGATTYNWVPSTGLSATSGSVVTASPTVTTTYTLMGTAGSCTSIATSIVTVNPAPTITVNSPTICAGATTTLTANGAVTYTWNPSSTSGSTLAVTPSVTTIYTVTGTSSGCLSSPVSSTVTVIPTTTIFVSSNINPVCAGSPATLTATGATTYTWSPSGSLSSANGATVTATPTANTTYSVTGKTGTCPSIPAFITLTVTPLPSVTVNDAIICAGSSATLTASGANTYTWSTTATGPTISPSPTITTTYTVTGTDINNCKNTTISTVTVNSLPVVTVNSATICLGNAATLTASGAATYSWSTAEVGATISQSPTVTTNYTVTGTDVNSCKNVATSTVTVNPSIVVTVNSATICAGATTTLTANGASTYSWSSSIGLGTTNTVTASPLTTTIYTVTGTTGVCSGTATSMVTVNSLPILSVNNPTICVGATTTLMASGANTYTWNTSATGLTINVSPAVTTNYTVIGTDINNCTDTATSTITVNPLPIVTVNNATTCVGSSISLTASGANTYTWNTSATGATINASPTVSTGYTVIGTDINNCMDTATATVTIKPLPVISVNNDTICEGANASLTANGANSYTWNTSATGATISPSLTITTNYTVTGTDNNGCINGAVATVYVNPTPTVIASGSSSVCIGQAINLSANTIPGAIYLWNGPNNFTSSSQTYTLNNASLLNAGTYTLSISLSGCSATNTIVVSVDSMPTIANAGMDTVIYNSSFALNGNVPLTGTGTWSVISGSGTFANSNNPNTVVNNLQAGQNVLQWTISNGACYASFNNVIITVKTLMIPNGFSPNSDGTNDYFEITELEEYGNVKLNIFNRWGNLVYESDNYKNDWDGKNMSGENLSDDTYFYTLDIPDKNTFKGYVVLKRK